MTPRISDGNHLSVRTAMAKTLSAALTVVRSFSLLAVFCGAVLAGPSVAGVHALPELAIHASPQVSELKQAATLEEILNWNGAKTRVYQLQSNDRVVVIDFKDLEAQANALNRIAALIEKKNTPKDRILSQRDIWLAAGGNARDYNHYYLGHNYEAVHLAKFFNLARQAQVSLRLEERQVLDWLVKAEILTREGQKILPHPLGAVMISIAQARDSQNDRFLTSSQRRDTLYHESRHAEFSANPYFKQYVIDFWQRLPASRKNAIRKVLSSLGYDPSNEELMANEFQAYLGTGTVASMLDIYIGKTGSSLEEIKGAFFQGVDATALTIVRLNGKQKKGWAQASPKRALRVARARSVSVISSEIRIFSP